ncbi:MAG: hypothetical protein AB4911_14030 [Oscillochloridaceae bacterium umkhey_bin13]
MPHLRTLLGFALLVFCLVPAPVLAQDAGASLVLEPTPHGATLRLSCPQPGAVLRVLVNDQPAQVTPLSPARELPPTVALLLEESAAMDGIATPLRTRRTDAHALATRLTELAPTGTRFSLIAVTPEGATLLATPDQQGAIVVPSTTIRGTPDLGAGLALAYQMLEPAPAGPRVVVAFLASVPRSLPSQAELAGASLIVIGLQADGDEALAALTAAVGGDYLPYHTRSLAERARLQVRFEGSMQAVLEPGVAQHLAVTDLAPGVHRLTILGCGQPIMASLPIAPGSAPVWPTASLGALAAGLGLGWLMRRGATQKPMPAPPEAPASSSILEQTTTRQGTVLTEQAALRLVAWDRRGRHEHQLTGRQWLLGSAPHCNVPLEAEGVTPLQVRLALVGPQLEVTALDGVVTLGSPLGQPLAHGAPEPLAWGELVCLGGSTRLKVERLGAA